MVERGLLGRFEPIDDLCLFLAGMLALRPRYNSGRSGGYLLREFFAVGEDGGDTFRVVVAAAVLAVLRAVFHFLSCRTSSKYSRLGQWVQVVKRRAFVFV
jgi:hypothetical protein